MAGAGGYEGEPKSVGESEKFEPEEISLEDALAFYSDARKYVDNSFRKEWDDAYKVYKRKRVKRHYEGVSDPVIPESFTIIETLVANIAGGNPTFHFVKTNEEQADDTSVLNGMLDYFMICNQMGLKNQQWVRDALLYGTGILHITWRKGKPFIENIPLRDFFVDPTSTTLATARYAGYEYLMDRKTAERQMVYSASENKMVKRYKNLNKIGAAPSRSGDGNYKPMDKAFKEMFNKSTLGEKATEDQIHIIRLYDRISGKLMEIGNQKEFIYYDDSPFQRKEKTRTVMVEGPEGEPVESVQKLDAIDPFLPFAVLRDYVDTSLFYGEGEMAVILDRAEMLNDLEAMDVDNMAVTGAPMFQIDPQFADLAPQIETIAGAVYPIPKGAISPIPIAEISVNLDEKKDRVARQMRTATAADEAVQGVSADKGRVTATEVSTQLSQAQNRFSTKISNLENEGYWQLGSAIFKMVQIFVTTEQAVRIVGPKGTSFKDFDPWEYNGEWEPHPQLDTTQQKKQMEVGQKQNQMFEIIKDDPQGLLNPLEVKRFMMQTVNPDLSDEKFNSLIKAPVPPPPPPPPYELWAKLYIDDGTPPDIKRQIEKGLGLTPSEVGNDMAANRHIADTLGKTINDTPIGPSAPPAPAPVRVPAGMVT